MRLKHIILTTCLFSSTLAMAELPQDSRRPGGIAVIPLTSDITQVTFQHKPVLISQEGQQRYEPYRVCRRLNILRDYSDEKTKLYPRN
ncbi:hypothetical protein DOL94_16340 [Acinetobacter baumannii]|uniref:Uncharacterized protein n=1 Tax=Acinetobacter baumannii TaxID=470 RepID=A0A3F3MJJ9_ACIBA|nr:hypothetical protein DOL94_16340 [Acinetobacter baumannii]